MTEDIERHAIVRVGYRDLDGTEQSEKADGLLVCHQQETDQFDGHFWTKNVSSHVKFLHQGTIEEEGLPGDVLGSPGASGYAGFWAAITSDGQLGSGTCRVKTQVPPGLANSAEFITLRYDRMQDKASNHEMADRLDLRATSTGRETYG